MIWRLPSRTLSWIASGKAWMTASLPLTQHSPCSKGVA
jgi:hypothetical protein